jgi:hypothetical protein
MTTFDDPRVFRASALRRSVAPAGLADWPPRGSVLEFAGDRSSGCTSLAVLAVLQAQRRGETVAWLQPQNGSLFPPDLAANGVDLAALAIVQPPVAARTEGGDGKTSRRRGRSERRERGSYELPRAAELLLRSGGFDLLVLDLRPVPPPRGPWLHRLQALVRLHRSRLLLLAERAQPIEPSSAIGQRLLPTRRRQPSACQPNTTVSTLNSAPFALVLEPLANKLHAALPSLPPFAGPGGVR